MPVLVPHLPPRNSSSAVIRPKVQPKRALQRRMAPVLADMHSTAPLLLQVHQPTPHCPQPHSTQPFCRELHCQHCQGLQAIQAIEMADSDSELSPKSPAWRMATDPLPTAFASPNTSALQVFSAGVNTSATVSAVPPLRLSSANLEPQPSATNLVTEQQGNPTTTPAASTQQGQPSSALAPATVSLQRHGNDLQAQIILDPATPRTPKHQLAEHVMTTGSTAQAVKQHMDSVFKVYATHTRPNFELPWQRRQQYTSKSTGFAVKSENGEHLLLTNAHSVTHHTQVQLKKRGDDDKYSGKVLAIATECDLALLTVTDGDFWEGITPLELGDLPALQENVAVLGYPIGGDSLAVSAGVVSRVQMTHYSHGCMHLLAVQTDAAINSGNSGGPVLNTRGKCIGVAFQSLAGDTQSIGYVIPTSVVRHFLTDFNRNGKYTGFPSLNVLWQEMDSKALKSAYGMAPKQKGVLLRSISPASDEARVLKKDDVLLRIDGRELGNDGTVPFRHGERVDFKYIITRKFVGDKVKLDILREGQEMSVEVRLQEYQHLVPPHLRNGKPSYFIVGGLVFTVCTDPFLIQRYGALTSSPVRLITKSYFSTKDSADQQLVILSNILACEATVGYETTFGIKDAAVTAFNGTAITNLAQLARLVTDCTDDFLHFDLDMSNKVVVLDTAAAREWTPKVMEYHNISTAMSKDVEEEICHWREEGKAGRGDGGSQGQQEAPATLPFARQEEGQGQQEAPATPLPSARQEEGQGQQGAPAIPLPAVV